MTNRKSLVIGVFAVLLFIFVWDACGYSGCMDTDLFPPITRVLKRAFELILDPVFVGKDVFGSLFRLVTAAVLVLPIALFLGILAGVQPWLRAVLEPFVNFTLPLPKVAIFPLMLAIFGIGDLGKIILIGIGLFYPLFINMLHGTLRLTSGDFVDLTRIYGVRGWPLWSQIYWRGLIGDIIVGLKASLGYGFTLVIVSELSVSNNGLGNFIWRSWDSFQILDMYAAVFWLCFFGWIVQTSLDYALTRHLRLNPSRT